MKKYSAKCSIIFAVSLILSIFGTASIGILAFDEDMILEEMLQ